MALDAICHDSLSMEQRALMWTEPSSTTDSNCELAIERGWSCLHTSCFADNLEDGRSSSFLGPNFEGPHPPTLGPRSSAGSTEETLRHEETFQHSNAAAVHDESDPLWRHADRQLSFDSDSSSRRSSRDNTEALLEIDEILRDAGCESPISDNCQRSPRYRPMPPLVRHHGSSFDEDCFGRFRSPEEDLRAAVTRALSICAFLRTDTDRVLEFCAAGRAGGAATRSAELRLVREAHRRCMVTARFCRLPRNNASLDLQQLERDAHLW